MKKTNENGITLIALVVTIVVLLILAGITITYVLSGNGVFNTAKQAANAQIAAQIQDYASQIQSDVTTQCLIKNAVGSLPTGMTSLIATGVDEEAKTATISDIETIKPYFPSELFTAKTNGSSLALKINLESGQITEGSYDVHPKDDENKLFTVTYTNGTVTVALKDE